MLLQKKSKKVKGDSLSAIQSKWYLYEYASFLSETMPGSETQTTCEPNSQQQVKIAHNTIFRGAWSL